MSSKTKNLIKILHENDSRGIKFLDTKNQLLGLGYTENDIAHALYEAPYDGKPNKKAGKNPAHDYFKRNPRHAGKVAGELLANLKTEDRNKAIVHGAAAEFGPGRHVQAVHSMLFFDEIGLPFYRILFFYGLLLVSVIVWDLPPELLNLYGIVILVWGLYRFIKTKL